MDKEFEILGKFWLPETPDAHVDGSLHFTPGDSIELQLQGYLNGVDNEIPPPPEVQPPIILGCSQDGKDITLFECRQTSNTFRVIGFGSSSFIAQFAFIGANFLKPEDVKFESVSIIYSNFNEWVNIKSIDFDTKNNFDSIIITYTKPESVHSDIGDFRFSIIHGLTGSTVFKPNDYHIAPQESLEIRSLIGEKDFTEYLKYIRLLQNFLSLAMGKAAYPVKIYGSTSVNSITKKDGQTIHYPLVDIYYPVAMWPDRIEEQHFSEMLFTFKDIEDDFGKYIREWRTKSELLKPVIDLYFSIYYMPESYLEIKFLSMAQAVETYHRRAYGGQYQNKEDYLKGLYGQMVEAIPKDLDTDFRESIENRIKYGYEYSLQKRLMELTKQLSPNLDLKFIKNSKNRTNFVWKVICTRNYLTHYSEELRARAAQGPELMYLTLKLQLILEICLLLELGFSYQRIRNLIIKSKRYQYISYEPPKNTSPAMARA